MDIFGNKTGDLGHGVANDIEEGDNVRTASKVLEDFDFSFDFLLLDGFENFDDAFLLCLHVYAFEDLCGRRLATLRRTS